MEYADRMDPDDFRVLVRASEPWSVSAASASVLSADPSSASAQKRADVNEKDQSGRTALDSAREEEEKEGKRKKGAKHSREYGKGVGNDPFFLFGSATDALAKSVAGMIAQGTPAQSNEDRLQGMSFVRKTDALLLRGSDAECTQEALERWTLLPTQSTTWSPNTEQLSTATQFASLAPFCPSSTPDLVHEMVVSDGCGGQRIASKGGGYFEYSCGLCAENKSGRRWQCWRCKIDYCFACRPGVPTAVLPPAKDELTVCSALQAICLHARNGTNTKRAAGWTNENTESSVDQPGNLRQTLQAVEYVDRPVVKYVDRPVVKYVEVVKEVPVVKYVEVVKEVPVVEYVDRPVVKYVEVVKEVPVVEYREVLEQVPTVENREVVEDVHLEQMERIAEVMDHFVFFLEAMHHTESAKWAKQKAQAARDREQRAADTNDTNELRDKELRELRRTLTGQETFYREFYREKHEAQRNELCQLQCKLAERESMQAQSEEDLYRLRNKLAEHQSIQAQLEDQLAQHHGAMQRMLEDASQCQKALQLAHRELKSRGQRLETEHLARCDAEQKLQAVTEQAAKDLAKLHAVTERAQEMEMEFDLIQEEKHALHQDKENILQMKEQLDIQRINLQAMKNDLPTQIRGAQKAERERTRELLAQASKASGEQLLRALERLEVSERLRISLAQQCEEEKRGHDLLETRMAALAEKCSMLQEREEVHLATIQRLGQRLALEIKSNQRLSSFPTDYLANDEFVPRALHTSVINPGSILAKDSLSSLLFLVEGHVPHADHSPEKYHTALQHHHDIEDALTPAAAHEASGATEKMPDELPFELILSPTIEVEFDFRAAQDKAEDDEVREDKARNAEQMEMLASQPT